MGVVVAQIGAGIVLPFAKQNQNASVVQAAAPTDFGVESVFGLQTFGKIADEPAPVHRFGFEDFFQ